jgi:predicted GNAT superfamily acetyltransferase
MTAQNEDTSKEITLAGSSEAIVLRRLKSPQEYNECVELQEETWGKGFAEHVPASILMVTQKIGGVAAGAFDKRGRMIGFVFGMTGVKKGRLVHWSDMLAVREDVRGLGLGQALKLYQRDLLIPIGVEEIYWTYDPLVARNAHLNLNRLGGEISEYVVEMYPDDSRSELHRGIGMDRFIVVWRITSKRVERSLAGTPDQLPKALLDAPVVNATLGSDGRSSPSEGELKNLPAVRVEIPSDILAVRDTTLDVARRWRASTRKAFLHYLEKEYEVKGFHRDDASGRCFYLLTGA